MKKNNYNTFICFSEDVNIYMKNGTNKTINKIKIGESIINYNIKKSKIENVVVERIASSNHTIINTIIFSNGILIRSTIDHPFFIIGKGWCSVSPNITNKNYNLNVSEIKIGDTCLFFNGIETSNVQIVDIKTEFGKYKMYNISGGNNHNFFANGILVHDENLMNLNLTKQKVEFELLESIR